MGLLARLVANSRPFWEEKTRQDRAARIDAVTVTAHDRPRPVVIPRDISPEMEAAEEWLRPMRVQATVSDRLEAYRGLLKLPSADAHASEGR